MITDGVRMFSGDYGDWLHERRKDRELERRTGMKHNEPRWVPYGNSFTLVGMHGCISSQEHRKRAWVDRLFAFLERVIGWRRK